MTNPLLAKVKLPGRVFALPSKGVFYGPGVLSEHVKDGEITVSPMSALIEMKLRSADLLYSGKVIQDVCIECIPEILRPGDLITKDIDAIFTFLRIASYGPTMSLQSSHYCENAQSHHYEVQIENIIMNPNNDCLKHKDLLYKIRLSNGQVVNTHPGSYNDSLRTMHVKIEMERNEQNGVRPSDDDIEKIAINDLITLIASVQNDEQAQPVVDRSHIEGWLKSIQKPLFNELIIGINKSGKWGFDYSLDLKCKDCGEVYKHELDLNPINFFFG